MSGLKLKQTSQHNILVPEVGATTMYVDAATNNLMLSDSNGTITAVGNEHVSGKEIHVWIQETFIDTSVDNIFAIIEASGIDIDKEQRLIITKPPSFSHSSGADVIKGINEKLSDTGLPIRLEDLQPFNKVTNADGVFTCHEFLTVQLRHVEIKDL